MKNFHFTSVAILFLLLTVAGSSEAQSSKSAKSTAASPKIELIQFHSEHRCQTCLTIETMTRETVKINNAVTFKLVNVDDKKNKMLAEQFQAAGTSLFLYNPKTGKNKELTNFALMNAGNKEKFTLELNRHIQDFLK